MSELRRTMRDLRAAQPTRAEFKVDPPTVWARLVWEDFGGLVGEGVAHCHPRDTFDRAVGIEIAYGRAVKDAAQMLLVMTGDPELLPSEQGGEEMVVTPEKIIKTPGLEERVQALKSAMAELASLVQNMHLDAMPAVYRRLSALEDRVANLEAKTRLLTKRVSKLEALERLDEKRLTSLEQNREAERIRIERLEMLVEQLQERPGDNAA